MAESKMNNYEVATFGSEIAVCGDPVEIARKVKLAFKKMSGEMALACFAKVMTADLPRSIKVAVWDAVRYSHIWWGVDEVLNGAVMENPVVQQAFADSVPMRKWMVDEKRQGWESVCMSLGSEMVLFHEEFSGMTTEDCERRPFMLIHLITHFDDIETSRIIKKHFSAESDIEFVRDFRDWRGNNILWYLTYRDDQNAQGGFACPCIERELLLLGANPNRNNNIGLCWNDVRRHLIRPEVQNRKT